MKTKTRDFLTRTMYSLFIGSFLSLVSVADATAHTSDYRPYVVQRHYVVSQPRNFPRWLRADRKFQRWYLGNRYRLRSDLSWQRTYDIYYYEKHYRAHNRPHQHKFRGRVMYDYGYRTYWESPGRRKHK